MTPVVVEPKKAANALRWAVREMEERYKTLAAYGVRNIEQFNRNVRAALASGEKIEEGKPNRPLPFIVVVVDELADLMMVAGNEVEESICRLAQMARAVGIHLILATQRPSVDVITGLIKANMPSRISFRVTSKIDSRTILDSNGAEAVARQRRHAVPAAGLVTAHAPALSVHLRTGVGTVASFLRKQGKPVYDETITEGEDQEDRRERHRDDKDELYDEAARIVVQTGQARSLHLQRKMRIGFSRAARLVDMMEAEGLVSAATGGKPREVLVGRVLRGSGCATSVDATAAILTALAAWLFVCDVAAQSAKPQTVKERYEAVQQRDQQVRVLLTNFTNAPPPADLVTQVSQVMDVVRIAGAPLPHQRLRRQRAVAGREPCRCGLPAAQSPRGSRPRDEVVAMADPGVSIELVREAGERKFASLERRCRRSRRRHLLQRFRPRRLRTSRPHRLPCHFRPPSRQLRHRRIERRSRRSSGHSSARCA